MWIGGGSVTIMRHWFSARSSSLEKLLQLEACYLLLLLLLACMSVVGVATDDFARHHPVAQHQPSGNDLVGDSRASLDGDRQKQRENVNPAWSDGGQFHVRDNGQQIGNVNNIAQIPQHQQISDNNDQRRNVVPVQRVQNHQDQQNQQGFHNVRQENQQQIQHEAEKIPDNGSRENPQPQLVPQQDNAGISSNKDFYNNNNNNLQNKNSNNQLNSNPKEQPVQQVINDKADGNRDQLNNNPKEQPVQQVINDKADGNRDQVNQHGQEKQVVNPELDRKDESPLAVNSGGIQSQSNANSEFKPVQQFQNTPSPSVNANANIPAQNINTNGGNNNNQWVNRVNPPQPLIPQQQQQQQQPWQPNQQQPWQFNQQQQWQQQNQQQPWQQQNQQQPWQQQNQQQPQQWQQQQNNFQQQHQQPPQQTQRPQIGGLNLTWDIEDFSVMFHGYGGAEMKIRRAPHPTTGEPWPLPQYYSKKENRVYKISKDLRFVATDVTCVMLEEAFLRYLQRILKGSVEDMYDNLQNAEGSQIEDPSLRYNRDEFVQASFISKVEVKVKRPCTKYPSLESDETYDIVVKKKKTYIHANEIWGALRGLETFSQLVWIGTDGNLYIKETVINDYPRFPHRGLLVDTSRHFLFKEIILDIIDAMEMNKLNVFHWHIVDDQSFPYESKVFPELSRKGAFHPTFVYSLEEIDEIIEYARFRGIRVMPEFDSPGHTYAWGLSRPELLTQCYSGNIPVKGYLGPIDPSKNSTYRFLQALFEEIVDAFKDPYIHLGGDEVPLGCWQSNPEVVAFAQELTRRPRNINQPMQQQTFNGWSVWSDEIRKLYEYYENRLISIISDIGRQKKKPVKYVMWQEVMNNNLQLPNDTIIQVWMGDMADVMKATSMGYQVLYSSCWYMDHVDYGTKWPKFYSCDPVDTTYGYQIDEKKVLGGEAAFWAEYFTNENLLPLMWPRASAAAERLWSHKDVRNIDKAAVRLSEHRCRMIKRGVNAGEISGPTYCLHAPPKRRLLNETTACKVFTSGSSNLLIILLLVLLVVAGLYATSRFSNRLHRLRNFKNRYILIVFLLVLLVYFLCIAPIWMRAFEFSGSFHKTLQEDNQLETEERQAKIRNSEVVVPS